MCQFKSYCLKPLLPFLDQLHRTDCHLRIASILLEVLAKQYNCILKKGNKYFNHAGFGS